MFEFDELPETGQPKIKVIGVGGGGGNAVNTMIEAGIHGVEFVAVNTDCQVLNASLAGTKVPIGRNLTKGLGAGANPDIGEAAALEDQQRIAEIVAGTDMVFVTAGMGGGTGTGAAPVVAQIAREAGALTVGIVTRPFAFEGIQRKKRSMAGIEKFARSVDALIVIPNDRLLQVAGKKTSLKDAFTLVDAVCLNATRGISDLVMVPGLINVDFADVRTIMSGAGRALMGTGRASGENRCVEAARMAINSPLLEDVSINGATGILVNVSGGPDMTLNEVSEACNLIYEAVDRDCNIIFGSVVDSNAGDEVRITVIATGFQTKAAMTDPRAVQATGRPGQMALPISASAEAAPDSTLRRSPTAPLSTGGAVPAEFNSAESTDRSPYGIGVASVPHASGHDGSFGDASRRAATMQTAHASDPYDDLSIVSLPPIPTPQKAMPVATEWQTEASRPLIRPQQAGSHAVRWSQPEYPVAVDLHGGEELGIEDSEFDKPTFLRRRSQEQLAADGLPNSPVRYRGE